MEGEVKCSFYFEKMEFKYQNLLDILYYKIPSLYLYINVPGFSESRGIPPYSFPPSRDHWFSSPPG